MDDLSRLKYINHNRVTLRSYDEFIGFTKGIIVDKKIDITEAKQFVLWLTANRIYLYNYIDIDNLINTFNHIIEDNIITDEESDELIKFIKYILYIDNISDEIDYVLGFMRGIASNDIITEIEAQTLKQAVINLPDYHTTFPISAVYEYFKTHNDLSNNTELLTIIKSIYGGNLITSAKTSFSTTLPLDNPQPDILFKDKIFTFTGEFAYGTRRDCVIEIEKHGGIFSKNLIQKTNYFVIGSIGNNDWKHSSYGNKIEKAIKYKEQGCDIKIISEDHWARYI